ncbi:MAG TPA: tetratricopeptide repeat protein [Oculatellaceae cyanobacterium]
MPLDKRIATLATIQVALLAGGFGTGRVEAQTPPAQPNAAVSMYNLGLKAYKEGTPESAIIFFTRACDINPDLADAQYNLGVLYQSQKRCKEAVPRFQEVLRVKPMDTDAHYQLALCYIDLGQYADARQHLSTIAPNNPHFADAQKRLSMLDGQQNMTAPGAPAAAPVQQPVLTQAPQTPAPSAYSSQTPAATTTAYMSTPQTDFNAPAQPTGGVGSAYQPQATTPPVVQPTQPTVPTLNTMKRAYPTQGGGPTPVLANCTVRIIATGFNAPAGLAFDKQGNLYVANFNNNTVDRINADGSRSQFSSGANLKGPIGLIVDGSNYVYVANYSAGTVARISPSGVSTIIATGFRKPYYLTLDKDGNLFVSQQEDNTVVRITLPKSVVR